MKRNITALVLMITIAYSFVPVVFAQGGTLIQQGGTATLNNNPNSNVPCSSNSNAICNPLKSSSLTQLLTSAVNIAIPIGAVIAVIMYVYVGFKFIFAQGKSEKINEAWDWFIWVTVGTAILIGAKVIVTVIESTLTSAGLVQPGLLPTQ